jgi:hypothetical protein
VEQEMIRLNVGEERDPNVLEVVKEINKYWRMRRAQITEGEN